MARNHRVTKNGRKSRAGSGKASEKKHTSNKKGRTPISIMAYADDSRASKPGAGVDRILAFYRPLKKPITLRLDADVLAWFKKDGKRYQTRINGALRKVMEREMKAAG